MEGPYKKYAGVLLVTPSGSVLMQQREGKPGIANSGKITTFGGSIEPGESPEAAALREIREETNLNLSAKDIALLEVFAKRTETHGEDVECHIYLAHNIDPERLEVKEGQGYVAISKDDDLSGLNLSILGTEILEKYFRAK